MPKEVWFVSRADLFAERRISRRALLGGAGIAVAGAVVVPQFASLSSAQSTTPSSCPPGGGTPTAGTPGATPGMATASASPGSTPTAAGCPGHIVKMTDELKFDPAELTIKKGETVTWQNTGNVGHTSTDDPSQAQNKDDAKLPDGAKPWNSGFVNGGQQWSHTFDVAGDYVYFCIPHEALGMIGKLTVKE
jgi:plastocyanin